MACSSGMAPRCSCRCCCLLLPTTARSLPRHPPRHHRHSHDHRQVTALFSDDHNCLSSLLLTFFILSLFLLGIANAKDASCQVPITFFGVIQIDSKLFFDTPTDFFPANTTIKLNCIGDFKVRGSDWSQCQNNGTWLPKLGVCMQFPPWSTTTQSYDLDGLDNAVATNDYDLVRGLLDRGVDVNRRFSSHVTSAKCRQWDILSNGTVLMLAASSREHFAVLQLLIERGAEVNAQNLYGWTALMWAASNGHVPNVRALLEHGADVNATNKRGFTSLMLAGQNGYVPVVRVLLDNGADTEVKNNKKWTAVMVAVENGHAGVVDLLLSRGADSSVTDGWTLLMHAAAKGYIETARRLIVHGASVNAKAEDGATALMLAAMNGETDLTNLLLDFGAKINERDSTGTTALLHALRNSWLETAQVLLARGADVDAVDDAGRGVLETVSETYSFRRKEMVELLLLRGATARCPHGVDCTSP